MPAGPFDQSAMVQAPRAWDGAREAWSPAAEGGEGQARKRLLAPPARQCVSKPGQICGEVGPTRVSVCRPCCLVYFTERSVSVGFGGGLGKGPAGGDPRPAGMP